MTTHTAALVLDARATLGEGALWHARTARLLWVDIEAGRVHIFDPAAPDPAAALRTLAVGGRVGTVVPTRDHRLLIARDTLAAFLDPLTGRLDPLPPPSAPDEPAGTRFNDGKCDPSGRFWVGSMSFSGQPVGHLRSFDSASGWITRLSGLGCSNGLAWTPDGRTLYFIDTPTRRVDAFDNDPATGAPGNRRPLHTFTGDGHPDGMTLDAAGRLWIALWGGGRVVCFDPSLRALVAEVVVPASLVTSCAFGGPDLATLYITTARTGLSADHLAREPLSGGLFSARPGAVGLPAHEYGN